MLKAEAKAEEIKPKQLKPKKYEYISVLNKDQFKISVNICEINVIFLGFRQIKMTKSMIAEQSIQTFEKSVMMISDCHSLNKLLNTKLPNVAVTSDNLKKSFPLTHSVEKSCDIEPQPFTSVSVQINLMAGKISLLYNFNVH